MAFEDYDVRLAFARIEDELIDSMMRNLGRHLQEEKDEGFDWSQWQVEQLKYLEEYRRRNKKKFGPQFADINQRMQEAVQETAEQGQKDEELNILQSLAGNKKIQRRYANQHKASIEAQGDAFFRVNDKKLDALLTATQNDMERAEHAVLRRANDQYRKIIFDAQVYANTGAGTIEKAVDMATKDFLSKGIDCIEYKNGARHTISDYADMYIRTAERRAYLMGEGNKRKEWGMSLVLVNKRGSMRDGDYGTACPQCIPWLGKVLIDDVYSDGKPDGKHKLLSEAMAAGFLHPRCKDGFTTYFPGISSTPDPDATKKELKAAVESEKEENRENYVERQAEKYERLAEYSLDPDNKRMYAARAEGWKEEVRKIKEYDSIQDAETAARNMGVKYVEYGKMPKETANILNDAIETLPPEARPVFVGDSSTLEKYRGAKLPRKSSQFYGVTIDAPPDGLLLGNDPVTGRMNHDFDAQGDMIGISSKYNTPAKIEAAKKKSQEAYMAKHDGRKWYFNMNGEATIYHEMGHAYQDKFGLPEGFEADAMRWARESGCDMLKTPSEAFSEAWGAYHTGNPELPNYIAKYIEHASSTPIDRAVSSVAKFDEDAIIKNIKEVLIPAQKTDAIIPRQVIHRQGTRLYLNRVAELKAKNEYGPSYVTISDDEIIRLVNAFKGTGIVKYNKSGEWDKKETIIDNDEIVGFVVNNLNGKTVPTSVFRIYYADQGIHIVPDYPSKKRGKVK